MPLKLVWNLSLTKSQTTYYECHTAYITDDKLLMVPRPNKFKLTCMWLNFCIAFIETTMWWNCECAIGQISFILPITHPRKELYSSRSSPKKLANAAVLLQSFAANTTHCAALKIWLVVPEIFHLPLIFS